MVELDKKGLEAGISSSTICYITACKGNLVIIRVIWCKSPNRVSFYAHSESAANLSPIVTVYIVVGHVRRWWISLNLFLPKHSSSRGQNTEIELCKKSDKILLERTVINCHGESSSEFFR